MITDAKDREITYWRRRCEELERKLNILIVPTAEFTASEIHIVNLLLVNQYIKPSAFAKSPNAASVRIKRLRQKLAGYGIGVYCKYRIGYYLRVSNKPLGAIQCLNLLLTKPTPADGTSTPFTNARTSPAAIAGR